MSEAEHTILLNNACGLCIREKGVRVTHRRTHGQISIMDCVGKGHRCTLYSRQPMIEVPTF